MAQVQMKSTRKCIAANKTVFICTTPFTLFTTERIKILKKQLHESAQLLSVYFFA